MHHFYEPKQSTHECLPEDTPFFREAIALIDQCTKLTKDDRISLRNKLKQYFKMLRENKSFSQSQQSQRQKQKEWQHEQMQLMIQIFVQGNKKRSLGRIQKGDKVMDWLQIKLRKFIDNHKKERHRKELQQIRGHHNLNNNYVGKEQIFKKRSKENHYNPSNFHKQYQNHPFMNELSKQTISRPNLSSNISKLPSFQNKNNKIASSSKRNSQLMNHSLSRSREKDVSLASHRKNSQNMSYNNPSLHQMFSHLKKSKESSKGCLNNQGSFVQENQSQIYKNNNKFNLLQSTSTLNNDILRNSKSKDNKTIKNSLEKNYVKNNKNSIEKNKNDKSTSKVDSGNKYTYKSYVEYQKNQLNHNNSKNHQIQSDKISALFNNSKNNIKNQKKSIFENEQDEDTIQNHIKNISQLNRQSSSNRNLKKDQENSFYRMNNSSYSNNFNEVRPFVQPNTFNKNNNVNDFKKYQKNTRSIEQLLKNSQNLINKSAHYQNQYQNQYQKHPSFDTLMKSSNQQTNSLFTSPDLLAECRRFLINSNKKKYQAEDINNTNRSYQNNHFDQKLSTFNHQNFIQDPKIMTFSNSLNNLNKLSQRTNQKQSRQQNHPQKYQKSQKESKMTYLNINQVISQNNSLNMSLKKPNIFENNTSEVLFKMKIINIYTIEELLLEIFRDNCRVSLDRYQLGELMARCDAEVQKCLQSYCDIIANQLNYKERFNLDFVAFSKYLYTYGKLFQNNQEYFSLSLPEILDIQKKGYIDIYDLQGFLQSIENSQLQPFSYQEIKSLLLSIFQRASCVECVQYVQEDKKEQIMTHWGLFYMELRKDQEMERLAEILSKFQFQYDSDS